MKITAVMIDRGFLGVSSPSFRPCKVARISFSLQMGKLSPREVEVPSQDIIGDVTLGLSPSKALDRPVCPLQGLTLSGRKSLAWRMGSFDSSQWPPQQGPHPQRLPSWELVGLSIA